MAKKPLGKDKFGVQKVMRVSDYFGDSLGQFALNVMSGLVGQLTYFYTDKVGLAAMAIANVLLITKIIDAFTDLIMGNIIDHTPKGKEKYRPWLLKAGIPAGIVLVMLFTVPAKAASGVQLAYALVTNILLSAVLYTAIAVPYTSLMTVRTNSQEERGIMGTWRAAVGYVAGFIMAMLIIPITNMLGGDQSGWIKFAVIIALFMVLMLLICYVKSRETATESGTAVEAAEEEEDPVPFKEAIGKLFRNKYWVIVLVVNLFACIIYGITGAAGTFYCKWIFGDDNLVGILGGVGMIPTIIGFATVGIMVKKLGVTGTLKFSFAIGILSNTLMIFFRNNFTAYMILGCFTTFATIPMMCLVGVMVSMAIDYNEYKYGVKMVASSNAAYSFGGKVGNGIGGSLIGWMLGAVAYDSSLAVATDATKMAIYGFSFIIPLIMFVVMFILAAMFDLEKTLPGMREEIAKRKAQQQAE